MIYQKSKKGLKTFIITYAIVYSLIFLVYFFIFLKIATVLYSILALIFVIVLSLLCLSLYYLNFIRVIANIGYFETTSDGLSCIGNDEVIKKLNWDNIQKMSFSGATHVIAPGTLDFILGKNSGLYIVTDIKGNVIKIPPNIDSRDNLVKEIIVNSHLQRKRTTMIRSIFSNSPGASGHFDYWERSENTATQEDVDVSPRKFSSLLDYLIATVAIIVTVAIVGFAFAFLTGKL